MTNNIGCFKKTYKSDLKYLKQYKNSLLKYEDAVPNLSHPYYFS